MEFGLTAEEEEEEGRKRRQRRIGIWKKGTDNRLIVNLRQIQKDI
jgi:uncharacterized protein Veg